MLKKIKINPDIGSVVHIVVELEAGKVKQVTTKKNVPNKWPETPMGGGGCP